MTPTQWQERMKNFKHHYVPGRNAEALEELVTEDGSISAWEHFQSWCDSLPNQSYFRGHREASWRLVTTLDRAVEKTISFSTNSASGRFKEKLNFAENEKGVLIHWCPN